ncbi:hypothetical protein FHG87_013128 [Trinorchestia longiramus]|nr:hypothetical protein FHG87_013128 [Trinorchestia longiramus]
MKHVVEEQGVMGVEQNGFRRDRHGEDYLFVVNEIIERKRKENKKHNVIAWNGGDLEKFEVLQNRVGHLALGAPKWTAVEAVRGDLGWSLFPERMVKAVLNYKVRIEQMENKMWVKQIFDWNLSESLWEKICWGHARKLKIQKTVCVRIGRSMDDWLLRSGIARVEERD